ncbi:MAG: polysaccharide deacetylase family protein, partial [Acutalibacteraceae bacterium]
WKSGDGLPNDAAAGKGADLSGSAANGAHKKMVLKATVTLTATDGNADGCWEQIGLRLRSGRIDNQEKAAQFVYFTPSSLPTTDGRAEIALPLSEIPVGDIDWTDVRQLNVICQVTAPYRLSETGNSDRLTFTLSDVRIVRQLTEGEVDTEELEDLVRQTIKEDAYTAESVAVWKQAVEDGKTLLADDTSTQEQVDAAAAAIKQAKAALVSSKEIDKARLAWLLDIVVLDDPDYPQGRAFAAAQQAARPLLDDESATQKQVNDAVMAMEKARLAMDRLTVADESFTEIASISAADNGYTFLQGGRQVYTDWKAVNGNAAVSAAGDAENGADGLTYLQMEVRFVPLAATADPSECCKQIGIRLRSSTNADQEADFFYVTPDQLIDRGEGWYTLRVPLRAMKSGKIDWSGVRQLNTIVELNSAYYLTNEDGSARSGDSEDVGVVLSGTRLVRKRAVVPGDVDGENGVTAADALLTLQAATGKVTLSAAQITAADVDETPGVSAADALMILQAATGKITLQAKGERKMVAFTFDDGPSENTAGLLDALKERGVHATFFVIGQQAEQRPELVARMAAEGHEVGNHSYSHDGFNKTTREQLLEEYGRCSDIIEQITGKRPTLMRAVGGSSVDSIMDYVKSENLRLCGWQGGGPDYDQTDPAVVVGYYMKDGVCTISDGDLVLLHENHPSSVTAALELIDRLTADGYEIVTVKELLDARVNGGAPGAHYYHVVDLS